MSITILIIVALALLIVAALYASVGHGGASGYLAVLALAAFAPETIRPTALLLNVVVSAIALWRFAGRGHFRWRLFWPFALAAVPCAFLAGWLWTLESQHYRIAVGVILLYAAWLLVTSKSASHERTKPVALTASLPIGGGIGILSGLIGVGGGIFLSPALILMRWATAKQTAAVSAAFILVSSLAGLAGLAVQYGGVDRLPIDPLETSIFAGAVLIGGFGGASLGASRFDQTILQRMLGVVLVIAAIKMFLPT